MKEKTILNKLKTLLGLEVKLEQMKLADGVTVIQADSFEPEMEVMIVTTDEQLIPLPVGEYELEDGRKLTVVTEGVIASVEMVEEEEEVIEPVETPVEASTEPTAPAKEPKSIIETTTKEVRFSAEEIEKLGKVYLSGDLMISAYLELPIGVHTVGTDKITVAEKDVPNWDGKGTYKQKYIVSIIPQAVEAKLAELEVKLSEATIKPITFNPETQNKVQIDLSKADKNTRLINSLNNLK